MLNVQMLVLDVDGVLTDGGIHVGPDGQETKRFHVHDGLGMRAWTGLGLKLAVITGRRGPAIGHRLADLGVPLVFQGSTDKGTDLARLAAQSGVAPGAMAYVGDDWPDLPAMTRVGYAIAPANADARVKAVAKYVTLRRGGDGAVREAIEHLLGQMGRLEEAVAMYAKPAAGGSAGGLAGG
ncbi:MAG: HAD hydrolase family protein [Phycisphaerales bacterium]|jgi:3-deoxy-D-manno-octulosonate 8-phosphate phosphatase (KDO 8-P phosphatase)|nr:HAD hydrolase family protein [Phycisphaerales bacterium]